MNVRLMSLPYAFDALEPHLSRRVLAEHHGTHYRSYVDRTRRLIENTRREYAPLQVVVRESAADQERALFGAAAHAWNHAFYWSSMHPGGAGEASGRLAELMESSFGTQAAFRQQFVDAARECSGEGWVWLALEGERLRIFETAVDDTALMYSVTPLLTVDLCEHAYRTDYQSRREDYVDAFIAHLANWRFAERNLAQGLARRRRPASQWAATLRAAPVRNARAGVTAQPASTVATSRVSSRTGS
jgi:Fe-Mn family superoxide dismutase